MADNRNLELSVVEVQDLGEQYGFRVSPMPQGKQRLVLSQRPDGKKELADGGYEEQLLVDKGVLEALSAAYLFLRDGEAVGTSVRIFTRPPKLDKILLWPYGVAELALEPKGSFENLAGLEVGVGKENERTLQLARGERRFSLSDAGVAYTEAGRLQMSICYYVKNENGVSVFGPPIAGQMTIHPPKIKKITWGPGEGVRMQLEEDVTETLLAKISCGGWDCFGVLPCERRDDGWFLPTDSLNFFGNGYALAVGCRGAWGDSYWTQSVPLVTAAPQIERCRKEGGAWKISLKETGCYTCGDTVFWGNEIAAEGEDVPQVRFAQKGDGFLSLGPAGAFSGQQRQGFVLEDGCYRLPAVPDEIGLSEEYREFENASFALRQGEQGGWKFVRKGGKTVDVCADFRELLTAQANTHARLAELREAVCQWPMAAGQMLFFRYGYDPARGCCDIDSGMLLHLGYRQYQNIPEERDAVPVTEELSDRNLSGFTGNGGITYQAVLREGAVVFEPLVADVVRMGGMEVVPGAIGGEGRLCPGSGIYGSLAPQSRGAFLRLMYPSYWKEQGQADCGSMFYFDNLCLLTAGSYSSLEKATENYRGRKPPLADVSYLTFRGKTEGRLMVSVFVEGHPQTLALGTTVSDAAARYGMGSRVRLERMTEEGYLPFTVLGDDVPLFAGDGIWHS